MGDLSFDSFEQYRQKGFEARRTGQWRLARLYLLQAATVMAHLSTQANGDDLRVARWKITSSMLELGKDCGKAHEENRRWKITDGADEIESKIIKVVRKWLFTYSHDLCIPVPVIGIADVIPTCYGFSAGGVAISTHNAVWFAKTDQTPHEYLFTLAHELRHLWQHKNRVPVTEKDANDYGAGGVGKAGQAAHRLIRRADPPAAGTVPLAVGQSNDSTPLKQRRTRPTN